MSQSVQLCIHLKGNHLVLRLHEGPCKGPSFDKVDREENSQAHEGVQTNDLLKMRCVLYRCATATALKIWDP